MENNIKNFIEEGEKEFEEKFLKLTYKPKDWLSSSIIEEGTHAVCSKEEKYKIKDWHSSRQISLIKMIVEMVEKNKRKIAKRDDPLHYSDTWNDALDTISSKLSSLVNGEK